MNNFRSHRKRPSRPTISATTVFAALLGLGARCQAQPGDLTWSIATAKIFAPSPRIDAPIAYDPVGRRIFLFGGSDTSGDRNDLWSYSIDSQQWLQINTVGTTPGPRHGHTVTYDPVRGRIIVIAGQGAGFFGDVWAYDIKANTWSELSGNAAGPLPRYGHSGIYDSKRDRIVISHGFTSEQGRYDDTWAFDLASATWHDISPSGTRPLRRCLHHAIYVPQSDQMLLYGGCSSGYGPCPQGDLWSFDMGGKQWTQIVTANSPAPRQHYGMVFDDNRKKLVLFGGLGVSPLNDTWSYDPPTSTWTQITPAGGTPAARHRVEAAFASSLGTAFFFGGESTSYVNDLLLLSGAAPAGAIPQIATDGIVDVFSGGGGPFAPGEIVSIYGSSLGPVAAVTSTFDVSTGQLPVWSANVSVSINGGAAPLYYVSSGQVNVQIPYELEGAHQASVAVTYNGTVSETRTIQIAPTAPRLWPGILNQDGSLNSAGNPAAVGDIIVLFATGQGLTNPPSVTGRVAIAPYASPQDPVRVSVGGQDGAVLFAGVAPGASGVMQVNVRVPAGIHASAGVVLAVGDSHSQNGVTLAVR